MVHLSVAIGRFFEALLFALARGVGVILAVVVCGLLGTALIAVLVRRAWRKRR